MSPSIITNKLLSTHNYCFVPRRKAFLKESHHHANPSIINKLNITYMIPQAQAQAQAQVIKKKTTIIRREMGISEGADQVLAVESTKNKNPRLVCLHGFRTSGQILKKQLVDKWPQPVLDRLDLVYPDAPFPCHGKSEVQGFFDPPYYEWFQFNKEFTEYTNLEECLEYIEDFMIHHGPFDGLLGFSQGAILSAALPGLQAKGVALTKVPKIKHVIIIGGAKFPSPSSVADKAYASPLQCPSLHFLGESDYLRRYGEELLKSCENPVVIKHPKGHTIPKLDEQGTEAMLGFLEKIQNM